jgi:hypothetical protein
LKCPITIGEFGTANGDFRVLIHDLYKGFQGPREHLGIHIKKDEISPPDPLDDLIPSRSNTPVHRILDDSHRWVSLVQHLQGAIPRVIIDDPHLGRETIQPYFEGVEALL